MFDYYREIIIVIIILEGLFALHYIIAITTK